MVRARRPADDSLSVSVSSGAFNPPEHYSDSVRTNKMIAVASLLFLLCFLSPTVTRAQLQPGKILWLTDINLEINPGDSARNAGRFGQFGEDTNVPLWAATIRSIRTLMPRPDFIIITGNSVSGNLRNISAEGIVKFAVSCLYFAIK